MTRPLCSVIMASYQRSHLLARSLICYQNQQFDNSQLEIIVVDDHSTDGTRELVLDWSSTTKIKAVVLTASPKPAKWVDCGWILNLGLRASAGKHLLLTHPEAMPGRRSIMACVERLEEFERKRDFYLSPHYNPLASAGGCELGLYAACKVYYLSPRSQELIDTVNWQEKGVLALREIEGFYDPQPGGNPDYHPSTTDQVAMPGFRIQTWDSWVFGGCSRQTWKRLGGMLESQRWGSVDILFNDRRKRLGMVEWTCPEADSTCAHQNHNMPGDVITPRDEQAWRDECSTYERDPAKLVWPHVDHLG